MATRNNLIDSWDIHTSQSVTYSGNFTWTGTLTANTSVTFPVSGTLATTNNLSDYLPLAGSTMTGDIAFATGKSLKSNTTVGNTLLLQGYNTDTTSYTTFGTITSGTTPTMNLATDVTINSAYIYRAGGTDIPVADGGTGVSSVTAYSVICGGTTSTDPFQNVSGVGSSGQALVSNGAGMLPTWQTVGSGTGLNWTDLAGTSQAAASNTIYVISNASLSTVTLPATAAVGVVVGVQGKGAAGWVLAANTGQTIKFGSQTTSSAGSLASTLLYDSVQVVCITADTTWAVYTSIGNLTVA